MKMFLAGKNTEDGDVEFVGIFDSKEKANEACKAANYWVGIFTLNEECPNPDFYFPYVKRDEDNLQSEGA